jgi:hypothetical protein
MLPRILVQTTVFSLYAFFKVVLLMGKAFKKTEPKEKLLTILAGTGGWKSLFYEELFVYCEETFGSSRLEGVSINRKKIRLEGT